MRPVRAAAAEAHQRPPTASTPPTGGAEPRRSGGALMTTVRPTSVDAGVAGHRGALGLPPELVGHPRYRVLGRIGSGGMGTVYRAEHRVLQHTVALKVIPPARLGSPRTSSDSTARPSWR